MKSRWFIDCNDSKLLIRKLNSFFMAHQELSRDLSEAKPLGTCRITTLGRNPLSSRNLTQTSIDGKKSTKLCTTTRRSLKEMSS